MIISVNQKDKLIYNLNSLPFKKKCFMYFSGDLLVNPDQPRLTVPISQIAPDLILADLPRNIMLNNDELEFEQAPEFLLGNYFC